MGCFLPHACRVELGLSAELTLPTHLLRLEEEVAELGLLQIPLCFLSPQALQVLVLALFKLGIVEVVGKEAWLDGWDQSLR